MIILILLLFSTACGNKQKEIKDNKKVVETYVNEYQKEDVIGIWDVFHVEIIEGRYNPSSENIILYKTNYVDNTLVYEFKKDFTFSVNKKISGSWSFKNDSIEILHKGKAPFPLNLNSKYKIHKGYFDKNWYWYVNFYDVNGKISHSLRVVAKRG